MLTPRYFQVATVLCHQALVLLCAPLFSLCLSTLLVCRSSPLTRCDLTPPAFRSLGKQPSCLTTSVFINLCFRSLETLTLSSIYYTGRGKKTPEGPQCKWEKWMQIILALNVSFSCNVILSFSFLYCSWSIIRFLVKTIKQICENKQLLKKKLSPFSL